MIVNLISQQWNTVLDHKMELFMYTVQLPVACLTRLVR